MLIDILSKLLQIKWNEPDKYAKFEPIAGGFPFIRVIHAVLYSFFGLKDWFIQSGVIADWYADKYEGKRKLILPLQSFA